MMPVHGAARRPLAPRYPEPSPARQPSLSAGASLRSVEPAAERARFPRPARAVAPLRRPGMRGEGERRRWGDEERRALPPRPLAHLQAPHAGGAGAGGRAAGAALPRGRCISGQGPAGVLGRFLGRCRPRLWGSCRSPRGWLYKYVCRCLSWGSVAGFCERRSGESAWKAWPSGAFPQDQCWGSGAPALRVAVSEPEATGPLRYLRQLYRGQSVWLCATGAANTARGR